MRVQNYVAILLFTSVFMACGQKTKNELANVEVKEERSFEIVDEVSPPGSLTSNFKTIQHWLIHTCKDQHPENAISMYEFGLFESKDEYTVYLVGINKYDRGDTTYTRIEFEPSNMYFRLPESYYHNLTRDGLLGMLISDLKYFIRTQEFKTSFFANADSIVFASNGQTIWSKPK